jgi:hypothetical protein
MAFEGEDAQRWVLTNAPTLQPAVDFITKSPVGPFIDTGFNVPFELRGRVYLSVETIREMAQVAGLLESYNAQEKNLHDMGYYNKGYEAGLKEGAELLGKLTATLSRLSPTDYSAVIRDVEIDADDKELSGDESGISDSDSDDVQGSPVGKRKSGGKTGPTGGSKRSDDVPSISDDNDSFRI